MEHAIQSWIGHNILALDQRHAPKDEGLGWNNVITVMDTKQAFISYYYPSHPQVDLLDVSELSVHCSLSGILGLGTIGNVM